MTAPPEYLVFEAPPAPLGVARVDLAPLDPLDHEVSLACLDRKVLTDSTALLGRGAPRVSLED